VTDRFVFQLGFATLGLGLAMITIPWLGAGGALGALAAVAVPSVVVSRRPA
jgi:hypothetical protein